MKLTQMTFVGLLGLALAAPVFAQPGPGMGGGMQGAGQGGGMGPGGGMGMRFNQGNTNRQAKPKMPSTIMVVG